MTSEYFPYTKKQAIDIVARYFGTTKKQAEEYCERLLDFNYKYSTGKVKPIASDIAEMENELAYEAHCNFYND